MTRPFQEAAHYSSNLEMLIGRHPEHDNSLVDGVAIRTKGNLSADTLDRIGPSNRGQSLTQIIRREACFPACQSHSAAFQQGQRGIEGQHGFTIGTAVAIRARMWRPSR